MQDMTNGMDHARKVGKVVNLDVNDRLGSYIVTGELLSVLDQFHQGKVVKTIVTVGGERLVLDWNDNKTTAQIEIREY